MTGRGAAAAELARLASLAAAVGILAASASPASAATEPARRIDATVPGTVISVAVARVGGLPYLAVLTAPAVPDEDAAAGSDNGGRDPDGEAAEPATEPAAGGDTAASGEDERPPRRVVLVDPRSGRTTLLAGNLPPGARRLASLTRDAATTCRTCWSSPPTRGCGRSTRGAPERRGRRRSPGSPPATEPPPRDAA